MWRSKLKDPSIILFISFVVGILGLWICTPKIDFSVTHSNQLTDAEADRTPIFPNLKPWYRAASGDKASYAIRLYQSHYYQISRFRILQDDCIQTININDKILKTENCNYARGQKIDLSHHLKLGSNLITINVINYGGSTGLDFYVDFLNDPIGRILLFYWVIWWLSLLFFLCQKMGFTKPTTALFLLSNAVILYVGSQYTYQEYGNDVPAHLDHAIYLYNHWWRTDPFFHAGFRYTSLYYLLLSVAAERGNIFILGGLIWRIISFVFYTAFLAAGAKIITIAFKNHKFYLLPQALFLLWPLHAIYAFHVNNDVPFYALCTVAFLYWIYYTQSPTIKNLAFAVAFSSISLLVKFNTLILIPAILAVIWMQRKAFYSHVKYSLTKSPRYFIFIILLPLVSLVVGPFYSAYKAEQLHYDPGIYGAQGLGGAAIYANNNAESYVIPTAKSLFDNPFIDHGNLKDRQNVWYYLMKTMLFGEHSFKLMGIARLMMGALCILLFFVLADQLTLAFKQTGNARILWVNSLFLWAGIAGIIFFRAQYNQTASQNFRYIVPCLVPFVISWFSMASYCFQKKMIIFSLLAGSSSALMIAAGLFYYPYIFMFLR